MNPIYISNTDRGIAIYYGVKTSRVRLSNSHSKIVQSEQSIYLIQCSNWTFFRIPIQTHDLSIMTVKSVRCVLFFRTTCTEPLLDNITYCIWYISYIDRWKPYFTVHKFIIRQPHLYSRIFNRTSYNLMILLKISHLTFNFFMCEKLKWWNLI